MYSHKLDVFVLVAQNLSFSEAANHLHIAQSAVSRSIMELEKELGVQLFERTKKGCVLTSAGQVFLEDVYKIINLANIAKSKQEKISSGESGKIIIGYASEIMIDPLTPCLKLYTAKYPNVELTFLNYTSIYVARKLSNSELDLGFGRYDSLIKRDELEWRRLFTFPLHVVMAKSHRLAGESRITVEMLENETVNLLSREYNPGFFDLVEKLFLAKGRTPILNTTSNDRRSTILMVRLGKGVTILSRQYLEAHNYSDIVSVPIEDENASYDIGVAWRKDNKNPAVGMFINEVDAFLQTPMNGRFVRPEANGTSLADRSSSAGRPL